MSIYTNMKQDYSFLFNNLSTGSYGSSNLFDSINLTDYKNIKNGTYYKVMKAYYGQNTADDSGVSSTKKYNSKTNSVEQNTTSELSAIKSDASSLYSATSKLTTSGTKSLFKEKEITETAEDGTKTKKTGYDTEAILGAVKDFVDSYNDLLGSAGKAANSSTQRALSSMMNLTSAYANQLEKIGITINKDNTLSIDEDVFNKADMRTVKSIFNGSSSYAANIGGYASSIGTYTNADLNSGNTYNSYGGYSSWQSGYNYNSFF